MRTWRSKPATTSSSSHGACLCGQSRSTSQVTSRALASMSGVSLGYAINLTCKKKLAKLYSLYRHLPYTALTKCHAERLPPLAVLARQPIRRLAIASGQNHIHFHNLIRVGTCENIVEITKSAIEAHYDKKRHSLARFTASRRRNK